MTASPASPRSIEWCTSQRSAAEIGDTPACAQASRIAPRAARKAGLRYSER
jgi:hypothetical protein